MPVATIAFHNIYEELNRGNTLFDQNDAPIGDDLLLPFGELRQRAAAQGVTVATTAVLPPELIDAYVFVDMPDPGAQQFRKARDSGRPLYLLMLESPLAAPRNYDPANYVYFRKIFTYNDSLVDGERFIKLNYAFRLPESIPKDLTRKERLCVTIAGSKKSCHPQELYSERLTAIRWFERNHPTEFDLYGVGWDELRSALLPKLSLLNRVGWLRSVFAPAFPSWRGPVDRKRDVMGLYRFALCYENIRDVPGYVTEKLFDAFFSGTVPVYRGADNVADHVPADCFIDLREFDGYGALYDYLTGMTDERYLGYLEAIENFLASKQATPFSCEFFAETLLKGVLGD